MEIFICGFRDAQLTPDEQAKLDEHIKKWKEGYNWESEAYSPFDQRNPRFENVSKTFKEEGKNIVIYDDISVNDTDRSRVVEAYTELKQIFPDVNFEANDENGQID